jgi:SAM-dependent methyltransferase
MENWFNTKYYHLLYKNRDEQEAQLFLNNLFTVIQPRKTDKFLDIACGNGRHSHYINSLGFEIHGIDNADQNILSANKKSNNNCHFEVFDMRKTFKKEQFDFCLNLFTSFGYFDNDEDDLLAFKAMANNLKKGGKLVFDFMNAKKVINKLVVSETKKIDHISFNIKRNFDSKYITKEISFMDDKDYSFKEKVRALFLNDISDLMQKSGLNIINIWGDYELNDFDIINSNRLIILAQK